MKNSLFAAIFICLSFLSQAKAEPVHGISIYGKPKYGKDFTHFDYVNPDAPKGGTLKMATFGTFDSLNPFIIKGVPATGLGMTFDTLLSSSSDEPFAEYGLVAKSFEIDKNRTSVTFYINELAKFHDNSPITADDVIFSFNILKEKGSPIYRYYYGNVAKVEKTGNGIVKFTFKDNTNRELPLIIGQLPILSKKYWENKDFSKTTLETVLGSGPYRINKLEQGRHVIYERVKDYWAKDLPTRKGMYNFDTISFDYYMDTTAALQALKSRNYDLRIENEAKKWETGYNFEHKGDFIKKEFANGMPSGVQGYVFNTRKDIFKDVKVREALSYAFDFDWTNKAMFFGHYNRTRSYFDNSEMASTGLPSPAEIKLLAPFKTSIPQQVFTKEYHPPASDGSGYIRENLTKALDLLNEAGWILDAKGILRNEQGEPFVFEILLNAESSAAWERISIPFSHNLAKIGITANIRKIDAIQYQNRLNGFDYDMISLIWGQSLSPGSEQRYFWGSAAADQQGSRNYAGIKNSAVDALIEKVISASSYKELTSATKALDRVLQWNFYIIPHWYLGKNRLAYWDKFGMPDIVPMQGVNIYTWWDKTIKN